MESLKDASTPTVGEKVLTSITTTMWDLCYFTKQLFALMTCNNLNIDLASENTSKYYFSQQENFLHQNRILTGTLHFRQFRILLQKTKQKNTGGEKGAMSNTWACITWEGTKNINGKIKCQVIKCFFTHQKEITHQTCSTHF